MKKHIPNIITLFNLLAGSLAIQYSYQQQYKIVVFLLCLSLLFDFLDGFFARLLHAYSDIGKELDSLADLISFGVSPAIFLRQIIVHSSSVAGITSPLLLIVVTNIPWLIVAFSALRLAKFNIDTRQSENFIGLPTPANAIMIMAFALWLNIVLKNGSNSLMWPAIIVIITFFQSILLILPAPMFSLKFKSLRWRENFERYIFLLTLFLLAIFMKFNGILIAMALYEIYGIIRWGLIKKGKKHR